MPVAVDSFVREQGVDDNQVEVIDDRHLRLRGAGGVVPDQGDGELASKRLPGGKEVVAYTTTHDSNLWIRPQHVLHLETWPAA